jgi:hypothetical protein
LEDVDEERRDKAQRRSNIERVWTIFGKDHYTYQFGKVDMEHEFAQLKDATSTSFTSIFLTFIDDHLLKLIWNDGLEEYGWQYSSLPRRTIAGGVFDKQTIIFY